MLITEGTEQFDWTLGCRHLQDRRHLVCPGIKLRLEFQEQLEAIDAASEVDRLKPIQYSTR